MTEQSDTSVREHIAPNGRRYLMPHVPADPIAHGGPGHRFADPGYCGGCWWEEIGRWKPPTNNVPHTSDCPACKESAMPAKYRKKPVVIDAYQLTEDNGGAVAQWCGGTLRGGPGGGSQGGTVIINTLEGQMVADVGDFVIKGVQGEFYPCKPDIFEATYDPADNDAA